MNYTLFIPDDVHDPLRIASGRRRQSVAAYILVALRAALLRDAQRDPVVAAALETPAER